MAKDISQLTEEELKTHIKAFQKKMKELKRKLYELEIQDQFVVCKHATFQLSEVFSPLCWKDAVDLPRTLNEQKYLGFDDWYLPDASELFLLFDAGWRPSQIGTGKSSYSTERDLWSANHCKTKNLARKVDFDFATIGSADTDTKNGVLCVRKILTKVQEESINEPAELANA